MSTSQDIFTDIYQSISITNLCSPQMLNQSMTNETLTNKIIEKSHLEKENAPTKKKESDSSVSKGLDIDICVSAGDILKMVIL